VADNRAAVERNGGMRSEILFAAAKIIVEQGYESCTMRTIAKMVHITAGSLYHHFASKEEIIEEIMNIGTVALLHRVENVLSELPDSTPFPERLAAAVDAHISALLRPDAIYMRVFEFLPPVIRKRSAAMRRTYANLWLRLFEGGVAQGFIRRDVNLAWLVPYAISAFNRVPDWYRPKSRDEPGIASFVADTVLRGIARR